MNLSRENNRGGTKDGVEVASNVQKVSAAKIDTAIIYKRTQRMICEREDQLRHTIPQLHQVHLNQNAMLRITCRTKPNKYLGKRAAAKKY